VKGWVELTAGGKRTWFQVRNLLAVRKANANGSQLVDTTPHTEESNPVWDVEEPIDEVLRRIEAAGVVK